MNTPTPDGARFEYHTPELRDHGTVAEVTQASSGGDNLDNAGYVSSSPAVTS